MKNVGIDSPPLSPVFTPLFASLQNLTAEVLRVDPVLSSTAVHTQDTLRTPCNGEGKLLLLQRLRLEAGLGLPRKIPALATLVLKEDGSFIHRNDAHEFLLLCLL